MTKIKELPPGSQWHAAVHTIRQLAVQSNEHDDRIEAIERAIEAIDNAIAHFSKEVK